MSTNKQAYKRAIVSSQNHKTVFDRYKLSALEFTELCLFLKPRLVYFENDYIIFEHTEQTQELKLIQE